MNDDRLETLQRLAHEFVQERDWAQYHSPRNLAMALSVEASELLELYLWTADAGPQPINETRKARVAGEAADVLLCLLNFCDQAGIDLATAFHDKLEVARQKYPVEQAKGRALKWDELAAEREE
ncbi:MAG: nucleotide pyrophosphohydrolase [Myxococcota bacterium]